MQFGAYPIGVDALSSGLGYFSLVRSGQLYVDGHTLQMLE